VSVGHFAPETKGIDLEGREINLRDYRGKVVVLTWWAGSTSAWELKQKEKMVAPYAPDVAIIGIYNDDDLAKPRSLMQTNGFEWPTIQDGSRRLMNEWNVKGWPTVMVVDQQGIIREREIHWELGKAVAKLLGKMQQP
jgi:peroxiredoxin